MRSPECPRCGYDLSGKLEGYRESCPLDDVCSECGCTFNWRSICGELVFPGWFVESLRPRWLLRVPLTLARCLHPPSFWRGVQMEHPLRVRRALVVLLLCYAVLSTCVVLAKTQGYRVSMMTTPDKLLWVASRALWPLGQIEADYWEQGKEVQVSVRRVIVPSIVIPLVAGLAAPLVFMIPAVTRKTYGIRRVHVMRIGLYGFAGLLMVATAALVMDEWFSPSWAYHWYLPDPVWGLVARASLPALTLVWMVWWWSSATRAYLRIDRPLTFALPLAVVSTLAGIVSIYVLAAFHPPAALYAYGLWE